MLTSEELLLVLAIAEEGSVSAAAERLATSQPALSRALGELERRLGVRLFERLPRGMAPTAAGAAAAENGRAVLAVTRRAQRELEAVRTFESRELVVGIVPQIGIVPVARALASLRLLEHPVRAEARVGPADVMLAALRAGELDVLIGPAWPLDADLAATPLFEDRWSLVVRAGHPLLGQASVDAARLAEYSWVLPPESDHVVAKVRGMFQDAGIDPPRAAIVTSDVPLRTSLVVTSDFISVLPHDVALMAMNTAPLRLLPVELTGPYGYVSALQRRDMPERDEARFLLARLADELKVMGIETPGGR